MNKDEQTSHLTSQQIERLTALCDRYGVAFDPEDWKAAFDLPMGWVAGVVRETYLGCSPSGEIAT